MAEIKILKDTELIGGTGNADVYPVTSTQAIYSQDAEGNVRKVNGKPEKLEDRLTDVQHQIDTIEVTGIAISNNFGDNEHIGISQKTLTESRDNLQEQINAIVNDRATITLTATPSPIFGGIESTINLTASTDTLATSVKIKKGSTELASGVGLTLSTSDTITPSAAGNITYTAEFIIAGIQKTTTKNVTAVYPIKYGSGDEYTDATTQATVRTTPAGIYNVTVANNGDYVFFVVPRTMNISSAKMGGFDFPLQASVNIEIEGVAYKYYQSSNTYDAESLTIVIS